MSEITRDDRTAASGTNHILPAMLADNPVWQAMLASLPLGIALLDAETGRTHWLNAALVILLREELGRESVTGQSPDDYLPDLTAEAWQQALQSVKENSTPFATAPRRAQFVHFASRNIAYWEWNLQSFAFGGTTASWLLLTVQAVSDGVMNERLLAAAGRSAALARQRAEALVRLNHLVNASMTVDEILHAIVHEALAYFEAEYGAVLLCPNDECFHIGYSVGLQDGGANAELLMRQAGTLAHQAIQERRTLIASDTKRETIRTPLLTSGKPVRALITSPIQQNERTYGVVEIYFTEPHTFPDEAIPLLTAFADQAALGLQRAELFAQIAEQRVRLQSIFDNAPVTIVYFDTNFRVVSANPAAAEKYEMPVEEMLGKRYDEIFRNTPEELFPSVRRGTPFHASHYVYQRRNGEDTVCDTSLLPIRNDAGQVVGLLLLSFEITELVQAQKEAESARITAENALAEVRATQTQMLQMEKMRAIGELASGVAHDLNNALMAILGYTELAEDSLDDPQSLRSSLGIVKKATQDASSTVQRLQSFARQRVIANGTPTDINEIVQDVVEMTRPRWKDEAQKRGRTYHVQVDLDTVPRIVAEASGLREVLINIIHNALDAMPQGGTLTLSTRALGDSEVEIEIADTGIGMPPEVQARIFDPFFTTRGVEGTGLGMAVSWTIIQRHGGKILVDSKLGEGTRFFIHLPVGKESIAAPESASAPAASPFIRVLVVDDEPFVASVLTSILTRSGHRVTTANSAEEGLKRLREHPDAFDLVLTDHGMPGMTGLEFVAQIKNEMPRLPVILLTGWGQSLLETHVAEELPDVVLGKPINQSDLLNAISRVLREAKMPPE